MLIKIWNSEQILEEWTEGIICPIYKKGDRRVCSNYRPITLLNVVYKRFAILLRNRLCKMVKVKKSHYRPEVARRVPGS